MASENEQLKKVLGEQTLEIAILRDVLKKRTLTGEQNRDCKHCQELDVLKPQRQEAITRAQRLRSQ
ncbi:hypothetical protein GCM10025857_03140 [Alicyclobacillus contaminans]|nr:hypothetical protein GCM10025857_03140 [Alicyclobacillus contaminans]